MSDERPEKTQALGSEGRPLTRSEQRRKNRLENRGKKKDSSGEDAAGEGGFFVRAYTFFVEAKEELSRVVWPTRKETFDSTWRLLVLVAICGVFLALVDGILTRILSLIV